MRRARNEAEIVRILPAQRITDAEIDLLSIKEQTEQQRKQLQDAYLFIAHEATLAVHRWQGARRASAQAMAACLVELAVLMKARGEMIRVLRALSLQDSLADVRDHICALQTYAQNITDPASIYALFNKVANSKLP